MKTRSDRALVEMRDRVVLDTLREHPWSSARMLSNVILAESGGPPTILTGALWIPAWTMYSVLVCLERRGEVERRQFSKRTILWAAVAALSQERHTAGGDR